MAVHDPEAHIAPYMLSAGTDAKSFAPRHAHLGFAPLRLPPELDYTALFHGIDERVPVDALCSARTCWPIPAELLSSCHGHFRAPPQGRMRRFAGQIESSGSILELRRRRSTTLRTPPE